VEEVSNVNSDGLNSLNHWKGILKAKRDGLNLEPPYDGVPTYASMRPEVRLVFDALSDVIEALTTN
jgi:hypothetical protein